MEVRAGEMVITEFTGIVGAGTDLPLSEVSFSPGNFVSATFTSFVLPR